MSDRKKSPVGFVIAALIGLALGAVVMVKGLSGVTVTAREVIRSLTDAGTVAGLVLLFAAGLIAVSEAGGFRGLGYSTSYMFDRLMPGRASRRPETFAEYAERKAEQTPARNWVYPLIPGAAYFVLAIVFLILFYTV